MYSCSIRASKRHQLTELQLSNLIELEVEITLPFVAVRWNSINIHDRTWAKFIVLLGRTLGYRKYSHVIGYSVCKDVTLLDVCSGLARVGRSFSLCMPLIWPSFKQKLVAMLTKLCTIIPHWSVVYMNNVTYIYI